MVRRSSSAPMPSAERQRYNAAFAVYPDGTVPMPYFKQILIPFGEYMPLASLFPALKGLNAKAGVFTAGDRGPGLRLPLHQPDGTPYTLKVSPLICYEDTVPALAHECAPEGRECWSTSRQTPGSDGLWPLTSIT